MAAGAPGDAPPDKPDGYVPSNRAWKEHIRNLKDLDATYNGTSDNTVVYNTSRGYHFTVQPNWGRENEKKIISPHITLDDNGEVKYYDTRHWDNNHYQQERNAQAPHLFPPGIAYDGLVKSFSDALLDKKAKFEASRKYDRDVTLYKKNHPWPNVVDAWAALQTPLYVQERSDGIISIVANEKSIVIRADQLRETLIEPEVFEKRTGFLATYNVVLDGSSRRYVLRSQCTKAQNYAAQSPEAKMLKRATWVSSIAGQIGPAIALVPRIPGIEVGLKVVLFPPDDEPKIVEKIDLVTVGEFATSLRPLAREAAKTIPVGEDPAADAFLQKAQDLCTSSGRYVADIAGDSLVTKPKSSLQPAKIAELPLRKYRVSGKYFGDGVLIILESGGSYFLAESAELKPGDLKACKATWILLEYASKTAACPSPASLKSFDKDRYDWIITLPRATVVESGGNRLIRRGNKCVVLGADSKYQGGGDCFVAAGADDCLSFNDSAGRPSLAVCLSTCPDTYEVCRPAGVLAPDVLLLTSSSGQFLMCPVTSLVASPVGGGASVVAVERGGQVAGFVDISVLSPLTAAAAVAQGCVPGVLDATFHQASNSYVHASSGVVSQYQFIERGDLPLQASNPGHIELIKELKANTVQVARDPAGNAAIVRLWATKELATGTILCSWDNAHIVSYDGADPGWDQCVWLTSTQDFDLETCDLLLTDPSGGFMGYANTDSAELALPVVLEITDENAGYSHFHGPLHTEDGTEVGEADIVVRDADLNTSGFSGLPVVVDPSPAAFAQDPTSWFRVYSSTFESNVLCQVTGEDVLWWMPAEVRSAVGSVTTDGGEGAAGSAEIGGDDSDAETDDDAYLSVDSDFYYSDEDDAAT